MSRELDAKVAEALGWDLSPFYNSPGWTAPKGIDAMHTVRTVPFYSTDIASAWQLDGDGWKWRFEEYAYPSDVEDKFEMRLDVTLWVEVNCYTGTVCFDDFTSKAEAYATARCLRFLQTKGIYPEEDNAS